MQPAGAASWRARRAAGRLGACPWRRGGRQRFGVGAPVGAPAAYGEEPLMSALTAEASSRRARRYQSGTGLGRLTPAARPFAGEEAPAAGPPGRPAGVSP